MLFRVYTYQNGRAERSGAPLGATIYERWCCMPPISPDNTQRFWVDYEVSGYDHTLMARAGSTVVASDAGATIAALFDALSDGLYQLTVLGFRSAAPGTNISVPETWPGASTYGTTVGPAYTTAQFYDFVGRGSTGHRVRVAVFGATAIQAGNDYRVTPAESAIIGDALDALRSDGDIFLDVDYEVPVWKDYANTGVNAYWRNKIR